MDPDTPPDGTEAISPEEAFEIVGDETRIQILRTLGEAEKPLAYSEIRTRIEYDSTNFHYHLKRLTGHFIEETTDGYALRQAGGRIVNSILSGTVTEYPEIDRRRVETPCFLCGGDMEMQYRQEVIALFCSDCGGTRSVPSQTASDDSRELTDLVGAIGLPPAGVHGRTTEEMIAASEIWSVSDWQSVARGVCPWCSASVEHEMVVCQYHDASGGHCSTCGQEFAVADHVSCGNCLYETNAIGSARLIGDQELMAFMLEHGIDPLQPEGFHLTVDECLQSRDPVRVRYTFSTGDAALTMWVDETLSVIDSRRHAPSESPEDSPQ